MHSLCKAVTYAIFKQDGNKDDLKKLLMFVHKKSANVSKFFLIILMRMSECWEAFFLYVFFLSLMLTCVKKNLCAFLRLYPNKFLLVLKTFCLQQVFTVTIFRLPKHRDLEDAFQRRLEDILEEEKLLR